ncbi:MAG: carboxylating nicotinate-nucleotide diphosphorylase [Spirochaetia bacterium]|nr:carboxylating nicotinate-nucleotide diphosphorylase [Spirochaetia bacterium]
MNNKIRAYIAPVTKLKKEDYRSLILAAIAEDKTNDDITTNSIFTKRKKVKSSLIARESGILCGIKIFIDVFNIIDKKTLVQPNFIDGDSFNKGNVIALIEGDVKSILKSERIALNFLSMLSGISTKTKYAVDILNKYGITALDTRKTLPGYRILSKYAVYTGGGSNHRLNLAQMGLIKDNHIAAAGGIKNAIALFRKMYPKHKCEVEVETFSQLNDALPERPEMIMLDNMNVKEIKHCVEVINKFNNKHKTSIICEASGGYNLSNLSTLAKSGVDFVSMGSLTNSITPLDFSLEFHE